MTKGNGQGRNRTNCPHNKSLVREPELTFPINQTIAGEFRNHGLQRDKQIGQGYLTLSQRLLQY